MPGCKSVWSKEMLKERCFDKYIYKKSQRKFSENETILLGQFSTKNQGKEDEQS
jgi:hypothetical protein